jgi:hypothetical protein
MGRRQYSAAALLSAAAVLIGGLLLWNSTTHETDPAPLRPGASAPAEGGGNNEAEESGLSPHPLPATLPAAQPVTIEARDIPITTVDPDSAHQRQLRDKWQQRSENLRPKAVMDALRRESMALPPDPQLGRSVGPGRSPQPGIGFDVIDFTEGGLVPPDLAVAAGTDHLVVVTNVAIEILDKTGSTVLGPTSGGSFFNGLPSCTSGLYDPDVVFDEEHQRYIVGFDQGAGSTSGGYCVAVSQSADPLGSWFLYFFAVNTPSEWLDFPHLGVGDDYIAFGGNTFTYASSFNGGRIWALSKGDLYAGNPVVANQMDVPNFNSTPQPLNLHGWSDGTWPDHGSVVYFLSEFFDGRNYPVYRWDVATGALTVTGTADLGNATMPVAAPQLGGDDVESNDFRSHGFEYRNGYGWTANTIACNPGSGPVNCVRWAQIDVASGALGPQGTGVVSSDGDHRIFPAVAANACNDMAIGSTRTSSSSYPGVEVSGRLATDPAGTTGAVILVRAGEVAYTAYDSPPRRWGDYTGMAVDPDGVTFWYLGEYAKDTGTTSGRWGGYVVPLTYASCTTGVVFGDGFEDGTTDAWSATNT